MLQTQSVLNLYKEIGETPLECIKRYQDANPEYKNLPMTYAGRLDPMAEGILLVLLGEECKQKEKYLGLNKEYVVEILFGFATDTYDILGKIRPQNKSQKKGIEIQKIKQALQISVGKFVQEYPKYSSKFISQKADAKELHTKLVEIYSIEFQESRSINAKDLLSQIENKIAKVKGDFRQGEILQLWKENLLKSNNEFLIIKIKASCSSGTYMRSLAHNLGVKIGIPALAFSIKRTKLG